MSEYLVHVSRERARLRSPTFGDDAVKVKAMEYLQKQQGIAGIKPGMESILIFMEPGADLPKILTGLEENIPGLKESAQAWAPLPDMRKEKLHALLASGVTTVGLLLFGLKHAHAWSGGLFTLLATNHIWDRRKRF